METKIEKGLLKPENFVYWLQGFAEVAGTQPTEKQWHVITEHLEMCFDKVYKEESKDINEPIFITGFNRINYTPERGLGFQGFVC